jgi:hypothetical protein
VINRGQDFGSLFQRLTATAPPPRDAAIEEEAAHAVEQWPLLALLTHGVHAAAHRPSVRAEPVPPDAPPRAANPLDHMFSRLERMAANGGAKPSAPQPVAPVRGAAPLPPLAPTSSAPEAPVTIEPRDTLRDRTQPSPAHLFERLRR